MRFFRPVFLPETLQVSGDAAETLQGFFLCENEADCLLRIVLCIDSVESGRTSVHSLDCSFYTEEC